MIYNVTSYVQCLLASFQWSVWVRNAKIAQFNGSLTLMDLQYGSCIVLAKATFVSTSLHSFQLARTEREAVISRAGYREKFQNRYTYMQEFTVTRIYRYQFAWCQIFYVKFTTEETVERVCREICCARAHACRVSY